jgi:hypothetical protein
MGLALSEFYLEERVRIASGLGLLLNEDHDKLGALGSGVH